MHELKSSNPVLTPQSHDSYLPSCYEYMSANQNFNDIPKFNLGSPDCPTQSDSKSATQINALEKTVGLLITEIEKLKADKNTQVCQLQDRTALLENQLELKYHEYEQLQEENQSQKREALSLARKLAEVSTVKKPSFPTQNDAKRRLRSVSPPISARSPSGRNGSRNLSKTENMSGYVTMHDCWSIFIALCSPQFQEAELALLSNRTFQEVVGFIVSNHLNHIISVLGYEGVDGCELELLKENFSHLVLGHWLRSIKMRVDPKDANDATYEHGKEGSLDYNLSVDGKTSKSSANTQKVWKNEDWGSSLHEIPPRPEAARHTKEFRVSPIPREKKFTLTRRSRHAQLQTRNDSKVPGSGPIRTFNAQCTETAKSYRSSGIRCHIQRVKEAPESPVPMTYMGKMIRKSRTHTDDRVPTRSASAQGIRVHYDYNQSEKTRSLSSRKHGALKSPTDVARAVGNYPETSGEVLRTGKRPFLNHYTSQVHLNVLGKEGNILRYPNLLHPTNSCRSEVRIATRKNRCVNDRALAFEKMKERMYNTEPI